MESLYGEPGREEFYEVAVGSVVSALKALGLSPAEDVQLPDGRGVFFREKPILAQRTDVCIIRGNGQMDMHTVYDEDVD